MPSSTSRTSKVPIMSSFEGLMTVTLRRASICTKPSASSRRSASRMGVRLVPNAWASWPSTRRAPTRGGPPKWPAPVGDKSDPPTSRVLAEQSSPRGSRITPPAPHRSRPKPPYGPRAMHQSCRGPTRVSALFFILTYQFRSCGANFAAVVPIQPSSYTPLKLDVQ